MDPFQNDVEMENHYTEVLQMGRVDLVDDPAVEAEMASALEEYNQIGSDLGIIPTSCKFFAEDPSHLTRWILGDEKLQKI